MLEESEPKPSKDQLNAIRMALKKSKMAGPTNSAGSNLEGYKNISKR